MGTRVRAKGNFTSKLLYADSFFHAWIYFYISTTRSTCLEAYVFQKCRKRLGGGSCFRRGDGKDPSPPIPHKNHTGDGPRGEGPLGVLNGYGLKFPRFFESVLPQTRVSLSPYSSILVYLLVDVILFIEKSLFNQKQQFDFSATFSFNDVLATQQRKLLKLTPSSGSGAMNYDAWKGANQWNRYMLTRFFIVSPTLRRRVPQIHLFLCVDSFCKRYHVVNSVYVTSQARLA